MNEFYKKGNRTLQDSFDSRKLADRLHELIVHDEITEQDQEFIQSRDMMFISTVDELGNPTVSYKGGEVGFVRVVNPKMIAFPCYDGNGMFLTAGNIVSNPRVGLLFIDFVNPMRIRLHGSATVDAQDPLLEEFVDAQFIIRISVDNLFINCPRYIHPHSKLNSSQDLPKPGHSVPVPQWKTLESVQDVLPTQKKP